MEAVEAFVNDPEYAPFGKARQAGSISRFYVIDDTDVAGSIPYLPRSGRLKSARGSSESDPENPCLSRMSGVPCLGRHSASLRDMPVSDIAHRIRTVASGPLRDEI